jgi:hypothetical protein
MATPPDIRSIDGVRRRSTGSIWSVAGLILTAVAMLLQIAAGSTLYPSVTGPIVLVATAVAVAFVPRKATAYVALVVPLVLAVGAVVAAIMTGSFIAQLTGIGNPALVVGSILHVVGLTMAIAGGVAMVLDGRTARGHGR